MSAMSVSAAHSQPAFERDLERFRPALTGYCYRMLGSGFEAEDATQETMLRAWRRSETLDDRQGAEVVAVPDRHERLPGPDRRPQAPGAADRPRRRRDRGHAGRRPAARVELGAADRRRPGRRPRRRSGDADGGPRVAAAGLRRRTPAPARAPTRRARAARGAALERQGGGRAAGDLGRLGQQRAAARARHARRAGAAGCRRARAPQRRGRAPAARPVPRGVRRVRHRPDRGAAALRRVVRHAAARAAGCAAPSRSAGSCSARAPHAVGRS